MILPFSTLLKHCTRHGIRLATDGAGGLDIDAPDGVITPDLMAAFRQHKPALLAMLVQPTVPDPIPADQVQELSERIKGRLNRMGARVRLDLPNWKISTTGGSMPSTVATLTRCE